MNASAESEPAVAVTGHQVVGRLLWRFGAFVVGWVLVQGIVESLAGPVFGWVSRLAGEPVPMYPFSMLAGCVGGCWLGLRWQFRASWSLVGFGAGSWRASRLAMGFAIGGAAMAATAALLWMGGWMHTGPVSTAMGPSTGPLSDSWWGTAVRLVIALAPAALWEELAFRGYLQGVTLEALAPHPRGALVARLSASVAFGVIHLTNPGAGWRTTLIVMLAGWALSLIRERVGVPAAWTAHFAWNWVMAAVLHVPVSGLPFATPGYKAVMTGPDWLSGGSWGPEGSVLAAVVIVLFAVFPYARTEHSRHVG